VPIDSELLSLWKVYCSAYRQCISVTIYIVSLCLETVNCCAYRQIIAVLIDRVLLCL